MRKPSSSNRARHLLAPTSKRAKADLTALRALLPSPANLGEMQRRVGQYVSSPCLMRLQRDGLIERGPGSYQWQLTERGRQEAKS